MKRPITLLAVALAALTAVATATAGTCSSPAARRTGLAT